MILNFCVRKSVTCAFNQNSETAVNETDGWLGSEGSCEVWRCV